MLHLNLLELGRASERFRETAPGLVHDVLHRVLNRAREAHELVLASTKRQFERVQVIAEHAACDLAVALDHFFEQRLERYLAEVPLKHAEADALTVEVTGQPAEAVGHAGAG